MNFLPTHTLPADLGARLDALAASESTALQWVGCSTNCEIGGSLTFRIYASFGEGHPVAQPTLWEEPGNRELQQAVEDWVRRAAASRGVGVSVMEDALLPGPRGPLTTEGLLDRLTRAVVALPHLTLTDVSGYCQPPRSADPREVDSDAVCYATAQFTGSDDRIVDVRIRLQTWPVRCPRGAAAEVSGFLQAAKARYSLGS